MNTLVKQDILNVLDKAIYHLKSRDADALKELSNHTIHDASIFQDEDSIAIAVITYAISKLMERARFNTSLFIRSFDEMRLDLIKENYYAYKKEATNVIKSISSIDSKYKKYVVEIINQAKIKKGSKIYDHGISLARAASMLGISQWELMSYIGKTTIAEGSSRKAKSRLNYARRIFLER